jgi:hypothetical protein
MSPAVIKWMHGERHETVQLASRNKKRGYNNSAE